MKTRFSQLLRWALVLSLAARAAAQANAQTPAELSIQAYAGLNITGSVGTVYSVDYLTDLAQTNTSSAWRCLEYLQLPASPYLWADKSTPATAKRFYRAVAMAAPSNMVFIPPGTFRMGTATNEIGYRVEEGPLTAVIISQGFWMGKYEVTQGEYLAAMGKNPSHFNGTQTNFPAGEYGFDPTRPVEWVSWFDAVSYCATRTQRERAAGRIAPNATYRLPTEAEWEYACRAWTSTQFSFGNDFAELTNYGWYQDNSAGRTHPVGQKLPNPWGLYDMHGNIWEWCQDWWTYRLPGGTVIDPQGPYAGTERVLRGGYWCGTDWCCRSALRNSGCFSPDTVGNFIGFRVVLTPGQT